LHAAQRLGHEAIPLPAVHQRNAREDDAEPLGIEEDIFLERQIERIIENYATRQHATLPQCRLNNLVAASIRERGVPAAWVRRFLTKQANTHD
jgi:hypothetical protein